jgi:nitronate monooxygenase
MATPPTHRPPASAAGIQDLKRQMKLPLIVAPMFLVSGPDLVLAACREGVMGSFPFPNARTGEELDAWMSRINHELAALRTASPEQKIAPWAANMVVHSSYDRFQEELDLVAKHEPPVVVTALGSPDAVIEVVHGYGGLVFADVNSVAFARRAASFDVDALVLVAAGAGGHTGNMAGFSFVAAVREFFDGAIVLAGSLCDGRGIRAGFASYMRPSIENLGLDPDHLSGRSKMDLTGSQDRIKAWKEIWSAGQGVGSVKKIQSTAEIIARLEREYRAAVALPPFGA